MVDVHTRAGSAQKPARGQCTKAADLGQGSALSIHPGTFGRKARVRAGTLRRDLFFSLGKDAVRQ